MSRLEPRLHGWSIITPNSGKLLNSLHHAGSSEARDSVALMYTYSHVDAARVAGAIVSFSCDKRLSLNCLATPISVNTAYVHYHPLLDILLLQIAFLLTFSKLKYYEGVTEKLLTEKLNKLFQIFTYIETA